MANWNDITIHNQPAQRKTLADILPVLAYPTRDGEGDRRLIMTNIAPSRIVLYQDDVTLADFNLPGGFAFRPEIITRPGDEVYMRFFNGLTKQNDSIAGVTTSMSFDRRVESPTADISIMFSGAGSRDKIIRLLKHMQDEKIFDSVDAATEQTHVKNINCEIVGVATGPTTITISHGSKVKGLTLSQNSVVEYIHPLTKEMETYFARGSESADAFRKLLDVFEIGEIVEGLRVAEIRASEAEIVRREAERVAAVTASLSRRRSIKIRRID